MKTVLRSKPGDPSKTEKQKVFYILIMVIMGDYHWVITVPKSWLKCSDLFSLLPCEWIPERCLFTHCSRYNAEHRPGRPWWLSHHGNCCWKGNMLWLNVLGQGNPWWWVITSKLGYMRNSPMAIWFHNTGQQLHLHHITFTWRKPSEPVYEELLPSSVSSKFL